MTGGDVEMNNKLGGSTSKPEKEEEEVITVVISQPEEADLPKDGLELKDGERVSSSSPKKELSLQRSDSCDHEFCRVCQQQSEETLMELGCKCRGDLAKAHRSCIDSWFNTRGSNKCEICQQVASNIPSPNSLPNSNYWMWRVDPAALGASSARQQRGCCSPLWVAFFVLIGGLLLDVMVSISLGVSAMPVNIIIGVLIVLGLGTAFRLSLECCHESSLRRDLQMAMDTNMNPGYPHPRV